MTNYEYYKNRTTQTMMRAFKASKCKSLSKFLDSEHTWNPKHKVGDIVRVEDWADAEVIVKFDLSCDRYKCISLDRIGGTILPQYCNYGSLDDKTVIADVDELEESEITNKVGELVVDSKFFKEIAKHIDTNSNV